MKSVHGIKEGFTISFNVAGREIGGVTVLELDGRITFGELERLVIQKLPDVVKRVAKEELESENWLYLVARHSGRSYKEMRVIILEFLDTDVFNASVENCVSFLDPLITSWDTGFPSR